MVDANQAGDSSYSAAPQQIQTISVGQGSQTVGFTSTAPTNAVAGGPTYTPTATASSGLPVTFSSLSTGICSVSGSTVSFTGVGSCVVDADQAGNSSYSAAPKQTQTITVGQGSQTIGFTSTAPTNATVGGATYTPTATASSTLAVSFSIDPASSSVCTISAGTVSFTRVGSCVIDADQAGDTNYSAAPQVSQTVTVAQQTQTITFTSTAPTNAAVGGATYTAAATASSGLPVVFSSPSTGICSVSGSTVSFTGVGSCVIDADQAGNSNYASAPQVSQTVTVAQGTQVITFSSTAPTNATVGGPTYTLAGSATSGLAVSFSIDPASATVCSISAGVVSFTGIGTCTLDANQAGDSNWNPAPQQTQMITVGQGTQTVSFTSTAPTNAAVGGANYAVTGAASSGLAVSFSTTSTGICSVTGSTVSFTGVGSCVIDADQAGDANYSAAAQQTQTITVGKGSETVSFTSIAPTNATVGGPTYTPTATATSGLAVTFSIDSGSSLVCSISAGVVRFTGVGTCTVDANQAGNTNWNPAPQQTQTITVGKASQTVTFTSTAPTNATVGGPTYTPTATATSGLAVSFSIDSGSSSVCTISAGVVSFTGVGTCTLDANQAGNTTWNPAPQKTQAITVGQGSQTVSFTSTAPTNATVGGPTYTPTATATSGLAVSFSIDSGSSSVCTISAGVVSFTAVGTCALDANQAGNTNWNPAPQQTQAITVAKDAQTITFTSTAPTNATVGGPTYTPTATAGPRGSRCSSPSMAPRPRSARSRRGSSASPGSVPAPSMPTRPETPTGTRHRRPAQAIAVGKGPRRPSASPRRHPPTPP